MASRLAPLPGAEDVLLRGLVTRRLNILYEALALNGDLPPEGGPLTPEVAMAAAEAARRQAGATHGLAVLVGLNHPEDEGWEAGAPPRTANPSGGNLNSTICIAIATADGGGGSRRSRLIGNRDWVRLGAVEMGLDTLRRFLMGLPLKEKIDFERAAPN